MNRWLKTQALRDWRDGHRTDMDKLSATLPMANKHRMPENLCLHLSLHLLKSVFPRSNISLQVFERWPGHLHQIISMCIYVNRIIQLYVHEHIYAIMYIYIFHICTVYIYMYICVDNISTIQHTIFKQLQPTPSTLYQFAHSIHQRLWPFALHKNTPPPKRVHESVSSKGLSNQIQHMFISCVQLTVICS